MRGRDIYLVCDFTDEQDRLMCAEEIHAEYGYNTYAELVAQAREAGWSIGKQELCPAHRRGGDPDVARHRQLRREDDDADLVRGKY